MLGLPSAPAHSPPPLPSSSLGSMSSHPSSSSRSSAFPPWNKTPFKRSALPPLLPKHSVVVLAHLLLSSMPL
ncbi:hypothetical protein ACFX12_013717 [Malus domestica]